MGFHIRLLVVALGLLLLGAGVGAYGAGTYDDSREVADRVIVKGGPIRVGPAVYAHANDTHAVVGVESVEVVGCRLVLHLDSLPGQRVMAAVVDEDESISRLGVQAGISGGNGRATIQMWKNGKAVCPRDSRFGSVSNLWVSITTIDVEPDAVPVG